MTDVDFKNGNPSAGGKLAPVEVKVLMTALMVSLLVGALDNSIMSTAMPQVISSLGGMAYYVWPFTIYMLASTIAIILSGKLSDMYGRKRILVLGIALFVAASILCGFAGDMLQLTFFRGLQGMGGGILMTIPFIVVAEIFPPRQRGKYAGILSSVFGLANVLGPVLGGFITGFVGWRWVFFINIPVGLTAIYLLLSYFPHMEEVLKERIIDYKGIITLIASLSSMFLALTFIENPNIPRSLLVALFIFAGVMVATFLYQEKRAKEPILPLRLFKKSVFNVSAVAMFLSSAVMFCGIIYLPLFIQGVQKLSPEYSGLLIIPMLLSLTFSSILAGQIISRTGTYKKLAVMAFIIITAGMFLLSTLGTGSTIWELVIYAAVLGAGTGMTYPIFNVAVQNAVSRRDIAVGTASMQFFRNIGATVALPIFGVIVNLTINQDINTASNIPPDLMNLAIHNVYLFGLIISIMGLVSCFFLKDVVLSNRMEEKDS
ncbi:MDR family MFS transporter [Methanobacterium sp. BAmetb5]|uniref:MDR family MFS transporter n=1 Tax=Methanobacterium sp. BAmetb5 TaxID=2025351 RepID=UPI000E9B57BA|nr:MDR family MFS transporter [Methanobacterium sp. BAmetb5]AXV39768.1 MAG: MFS transporter [Methanobacterium sp. BAmetb5]